MNTTESTATESNMTEFTATESTVNESTATESTNIKSTDIKSIDTAEQWRAANTVRAALYRWFADIFALELTTTTLNTWQKQNTYADLHRLFSSLGLEQHSARVQSALSDLNLMPLSECRLELAADFAQMFLLSGNDSAPPYASFYLDQDNMLYAKPAQQMRQFLASRKLSLHPDFNEPDDHISVYLHVIHLWINSSMGNNEDMLSTAKEQVDFLDSALLNWLPLFVAHCHTITVKTDFYPALSALIEQFVLADREAMANLVSEAISEP